MTPDEIKAKVAEALPCHAGDNLCDWSDCLSTVRPAMEALVREAVEQARAEQREVIDAAITDLMPKGIPYKGSMGKYETKVNLLNDLRRVLCP